MNPAHFVNKHLDRHENRLNLALFALLAVPVLRERIVAALGLPADSVLFPSQSSSGGLRPDLVATGPAREVRGWIEADILAEHLRALAGIPSGNDLARCLTCGRSLGGGPAVA